MKRFNMHLRKEDEANLKAVKKLMGLRSSSEAVRCALSDQRKRLERGAKK